VVTVSARLAARRGGVLQAVVARWAGRWSSLPAASSRSASSSQQVSGSEARPDHGASFRPGGCPAHGDQGEPEVADFGQQPVQRGLVGDQAADDRLLAPAADLKAVEPRCPPVIQDTRHADLILGGRAGGAHPSSRQRPAGAAEQTMPGGTDCACGKDPRLPCRAWAGLRAAIPVLPAACVSFMCRR